MVLLKGRTEEDGFVFFTNYHSRKGQQLEDNPFASLVFWWGDLQRQVRVEGRVTKIPSEASDGYWSVRPFGSQLSSASSLQSQVMVSPTGLEERMEENKEAFFKQYEQEHGVRLASIKDCESRDLTFPRPEHWGGYGLMPTRIEFWKGRKNRSHDRYVFVKEDGEEWVRERLFP